MMHCTSSSKFRTRTAYSIWPAMQSPFVFFLPALQLENFSYQMFSDVTENSQIGKDFVRSVGTHADTGIPFNSMLFSALKYNCHERTRHLPLLALFL